MRSLACLPLLLAPLSIFACGGGDETGPVPNVPPSPSPSAVASHTAKTETRAQAKVDPTLVDPSVSPCDDFYQYACGTWIKNTTIPGDESRWYRSFSVIRERNEEILHGILDAYAKGSGNPVPYSKQLGDYYFACMDEPGIEKAGTKPLEPWQKTIDAVRDPASLVKALGKLQSDGIGIVFDLSASQDLEDATKVVGWLSQGGLGMPEREYYLDTSPKMTEIRNAYEAHVAAMMQLAGQPEAKAKASAKKVLEIETQLAKAWMTKEDRREPKKLNHRAARAELATMVPGFPWDAWLDAANAKTIATFNVAQPEFLKAVAAMTKKVPAADWKTYLTWHLYHATASALPKRFVDENFKWQQKLTGETSLPERWKRCVRTVDSGMGEALGRPFVEKTLGGEGKANAHAIIEQIEATMHADLEHLGWMDDATRKAAFAKLGKVANKVAYPDKWRNYDALTVDRKSYAVDAIHAAAFEYRRQLAKIGKPVDRTEWQMSPPTVNAYYDPQLNEMVFPAGILQPPFYANKATMPTNFGGIGMVMGHELTHGFDDEGRQFDAEGNLEDWWSDKVSSEFDRRASCVEKQFDSYVVLGDLHVNGKLTLGENIADLGGVKLAYRAMKAKAGDNPVADQEFFLGFAQGWCGKIRDEALRNQVTTNPHSPAKLRVNGPLSNLPEFAAAWSCQPGAKMVRKDRCEVW